MTFPLKMIPLAKIAVPSDRARSFDQVKAEALAASIEAQGLFNPISVRPDGDGFRLVTGMHRYRAFYMLDRETIPARISDADDDAARLEEVMENLARAELTALDRCQHLFELKEVYERLYPEAAHGGDRRSKDFKRQSLPLERQAWEIFSFTESTAEKIGLSQRSIRLAVKIWTGLSNNTRVRVVGTPLALKQTELKALSELKASRQAAVLDMILGDEDVANVAGALAAIEGGIVPTAMERRFEQVCAGLESFPDETFDRLMIAHADRVIASLKRSGRIK